jgi:hemerythrin
MDKRFIWDEKYSVDNETIDEQHQKLFEIGNRLFESDLNGSAKIVMELFKYTEYHFRAEETIMRDFNNPNLDSHIIIHDNLLDKLCDIADNGIKADYDLFKLKLFFYDWLTVHVLKEDKVNFTLH